MTTTTRALLWEALLDPRLPDHLVTVEDEKAYLDALEPVVQKALGSAWDAGHDTAARCYWHKPRNPFTGEMNDDDPDDYCPAHDGTGTPEDCDLNYRPLGEPCPGPKEPE